METKTLKSTAPAEMPGVKEVAAVTSGIATKYWAELKPYPAAPPKLWLLVANAWVFLVNPDLGILMSVQDAFCKCPDRLEVAVWVDNGAIVGLVVRSK